MSQDIVENQLCGSLKARRRVLEARFVDVNKVDDVIRVGTRYTHASPFEFPKFVK